MKQIQVFDPGKLTGVAIIEYDEYKNEIVGYSTYEMTVEELWDFLEEEAFDYADTVEKYEIVFEKFFITTETGKKNDVNYSLEIIGVLKYLAYIYGVPTHSQSPSDAKNFVDNKRLKEVGLWHVGGEGHAKDALRHAVLYLVKNKNWRPKGLLE